MKVSELFPQGKPLDSSDLHYKESVRAILSQNPPEVRINDKANNAFYVPVQVVEELLDYLFPHSWSIEPKNTQWIANEIVGDGVLVIDCGGIKRTIWGSAAVMMQHKSKDKGGDGDPSNLANKITNTLQKDYPHLKSEVLKSAAKMLGNVFGRNLNRKNADKSQWEGSDYVPDVEAVKEDLGTITERDDLVSYYMGLPATIRNNPQVVSVFKGKTGNNPPAAQQKKQPEPTPTQNPVPLNDLDL